MHYFAAVLVPPDSTIETVEPHVSAAMAPYSYDGNPDGEWDWWQIGGRWTGVWSDYDPAKDPANIERCFLCSGSGVRPDAAAIEATTPGWTEWSGGCNGCMGTGDRLSHAGTWERHSGDVLPVSVLTSSPELRRPFTVVGLDVGWYSRGSFADGEYVEVPEDEWKERVDKLLAPFSDACLVVVDYHC